MLPSKKELFDAALDQPGGLDGRVAVFLSTQIPGLQVGAFQQDAQQGILRLDFSMRFGEALTTDDEGIGGTLSRQGRRVDLWIPWAAVRGITEVSTGRNVIFNYPEVVETKKLPDAPAPRRGLRLVRDEEN